MLISPVATWVGGGFIVGTAEMVYTASMGLIQAVIFCAAQSSSFIIGKSPQNYIWQNVVFCGKILIFNSWLRVKRVCQYCTSHIITYLIIAFWFVLTFNERRFSVCQANEREELCNDDRPFPYQVWKSSNSCNEPNVHISRPNLATLNINRLG